MGLAPYGDETSERFRRFVGKIKGQLVTIYEDGSFHLHQEYFDYLPGLRMARDSRWEELFGLPRREPSGLLSQGYCDLALAIQRVTEEIVVRLAATARQVTGCGRLVLAGGVALNCVANGKLLRSGLFSEIFIQPAAGDAGGALGAAIAGCCIWGPGKSMRMIMKDAYWGRGIRGSISRRYVRCRGWLGCGMIRRRSLRAAWRLRWERGTSWGGFRGGWSLGRGRWAIAAFWRIRGTGRCSGG
jgi:carbamoyltransferase